MNSLPITVGSGNLVSQEGFLFLMPPAIAGSVWNTLLSQGVIPMGSNALEKLRILQGGKLWSQSFTCLYFLHCRIVEPLL